jgi:catechol 2,3-dioxygenase-like lactoylglutathione lyase family enzyme
MAGTAARTGSLRASHALDHVGLAVPDLDQAVNFFTANFGALCLFSLGRPDRGEGVPGEAGRGAERLGAAPGAEFALAMLQVGRARLELLQWWTGRPAGRPPEADEPGGAHVAIEVADVQAELDRLRQAPGVEVLGEPVTFAAGGTPGVTNAFLRAPWGLLVELVHWAGNQDKHTKLTPTGGAG